MNNRIKTLKEYNKPSKSELNKIQLLDFKQYQKRDNISNTKCSKVKSKILKSKIKTKKAIQKIQEKNIKLAMYGLY